MTEVVPIETNVESKETETKGFSAVLAHRDFARLWSGQLVANVGRAISSLALMFFAFDLTGSAMAMAILAMVQTIPVVLFAGFVGVYVDKWNRKKIMIASDIVRAVSILLIPVTIYFPTFLPTIYWVYILTFILFPLYTLTSLSSDSWSTVTSSP